MCLQSLAINKNIKPFNVKTSSLTPLSKNHNDIDNDDYKDNNNNDNDNDNDNGNDSDNGNDDDDDDDNDNGIDVSDDIETSNHFYILLLVKCLTK